MTGYGYKKTLCEKVTYWFLNKFLSRYNLDIHIIHRGLKHEGVLGYCDFIDDYKSPRCFVIELDTYMEKELYIKTLLHELFHLYQWVKGLLKVRYGKVCYCKEPVEQYDYWEQPHEIAAREKESDLYQAYLNENKIVPLFNVSHTFPNRLMQVV